MKTIKNNKRSLNAINFQLLSKNQLGVLVGGDGKDKTTTTGSGGNEGTIVSNPIVVIKK